MTMTSKLTWKLHYAALNNAAALGEEVAKDYGFTVPPVSPFWVMDGERELIHYEGADFGNCFDGRIKFVGPRFLICYQHAVQLVESPRSASLKDHVHDRS